MRTNKNKKRCKQCRRDVYSANFNQEQEKCIPCIEENVIAKETSRSRQRIIRQNTDDPAALDSAMVTAFLRRKRI